MNSNDHQSFSNLMLGVFEYYGREPSESLIEIYWNGLSEFDIQAVKQAFNRHMRNPDSGQFMPKLADVHKMLSGTSQDRSMVAWTKVDKAIRQVGTYSDIVFDDPIIHRVIEDMEGWVSLGTKTDAEWPFIAKDFENRYKGYASRSERPDYPYKLTGITNGDNVLKGLPCIPPVLFGNAEVAKMIMVGGRSNEVKKSTFMPISELLKLNKPT